MVMGEPFESHSIPLGEETTNALRTSRMGDLAQFRAAGVLVDDRVEDYDYGRFGWATDPEGNRFELWEPRSPGHGSAHRAEPGAAPDRGRMRGVLYFAPRLSQSGTRSE